MCFERKGRFHCYLNIISTENPERQNGNPNIERERTKKSKFLLTWVALQRGTINFN